MKKGKFYDVGVETPTYIRLQFICKSLAVGLNAKLVLILFHLRYSLNSKTYNSFVEKSRLGFPPQLLYYIIYI